KHGAYPSLVQMLPIAGVSPEKSKSLQRFVFVDEAAVGVVWPEIVIIPDGQMVSRAQQWLQLRKGARMSVALVNARARVPINFTQIDVVAQPKHQIRALLVNRFKNSIFSAIRPARTVVFLLIYESTTAQRYGKLGRIRAVLPQGGCLEF